MEISARTRIGEGQEVNVDDLKDGTCVKVYCRRRLDAKQVSDLFSMAREVFEARIPIPEPLEVITIDLPETEAFGVESIYGPRGGFNGTNQAIRMQKIDGKPMDRYLLPSFQRKKRLQSLHQQIVRAGFVYTDPCLKNYLEPKDGGVVICDLGGFVRLDDKTGGLEAFLDWYGKNAMTNIPTPTSALTEPISDAIVQVRWFFRGFII